MARMWPAYLARCAALVYVVDATSCDAAVAAVVRRQLLELLAHEDLRGKPVLVCLNKVGGCGADGVASSWSSSDATCSRPSQASTAHAGTLEGGAATVTAQVHSVRAALLLDDLERAGAGAPCIVCCTCAVTGAGLEPLVRLARSARPALASAPAEAISRSQLQRLQLYSM
jgi:ADP-ribosylation factor family